MSYNRSRGNNNHMFLISMLRYLLVSIRTFIYIYIKDIPKDIPEYRILFKKRFCSKFLMFLDLTYEKKKKQTRLKLPAPESYGFSLLEPNTPMFHDRKFTFRAFMYTEWCRDRRVDPPCLKS